MIIITFFSKNDTKITQLAKYKAFQAITQYSQPNTSKRGSLFNLLFINNFQKKYLHFQFCNSTKRKMQKISIHNLFYNI